MPLSDSLPMLERMGLRVLEERPYRIAPEGGAAGLAARLRARHRADADVEIDARARTIFEEAFGRVFAGEVENDDFNRLVLAARLAADEIVVLRAYAKYLRQIGFPLSQAFIEQTLAAQPGDRAHAGGALPAALRSRARATPEARRRARCARSSRRSTASTT